MTEHEYLALHTKRNSSNIMNLPYDVRHKFYTQKVTLTNTSQVTRRKRFSKNIKKVYYSEQASCLWPDEEKAFIWIWWFLRVNLTANQLFVDSIDVCADSFCFLIDSGLWTSNSFWVKHFLVLLSLRRHSDVLSSGITPNANWHSPQPRGYSDYVRVMLRAT